MASDWGTLGTGRPVQYEIMDESERRCKTGGQRGAPGSTADAGNRLDKLRRHPQRIVALLCEREAS